MYNEFNKVKSKMNYAFLMHSFNHLRHNRNLQNYKEDQPQSWHNSRKMNAC